MAKPHTTNGHYTNPEVRHERSDIDLAIVVKFGVGLAVLIAVSIFSMIWLFVMLRKSEYAVKKTDLPPAFPSDKQMTPEPRLEAIEDLHPSPNSPKPYVRLMPPRAEEYFRAQEKFLEDGDPAKGVLAVKTAIAQLADKLPCRKGVEAAPRTFNPRLPSKAASGRPPMGDK